MHKMMGKEGKMNRAEGEEPKSGHAHPAGGKMHEAGPEVKAEMSQALNGNPTDHNPLRGARRELETQHPHAYHEHGPHHGTSDHIRHMPLHGMKAKPGYGR